MSASFNYRLEPAASVQVCTAYCALSGRTCIGLYDSFPDNHLKLDAWYQVKNPGFCGSGWLVSILVIIMSHLRSTLHAVNYFKKVTF